MSKIRCPSCGQPLGRFWTRKCIRRPLPAGQASLLRRKACHCPDCDQALERAADSRYRWLFSLAVASAVLYVLLRGWELVAGVALLSVGERLVVLLLVNLQFWHALGVQRLVPAGGGASGTAPSRPSA